MTGGEESASGTWRDSLPLSAGLDDERRAARSAAPGSYEFMSRAYRSPRSWLRKRLSASSSNGVALMAAKNSLVVELMIDQLPLLHHSFIAAKPMMFMLR